MIAILIAQESHKTEPIVDSLENQLEKLREYCHSKGFDIGKEFSFSKKTYKKQMDKINEIVRSISEQQDPVALCFYSETHLVRRILSDEAYQVYEKALNGNVELHFISDSLTVNKDSSPCEKFAFSLRFLLAKYYKESLRPKSKNIAEIANCITETSKTESNT